MTNAALPTDPREVTLARLDDQANWYSRKSNLAKRSYKYIKTVEIVAAGLIPILAGQTFFPKDAVIGGLGVLITILEGILQLNQYQQISTMYRATCEALLQEKYLYLANAGPYTVVANPTPFLAERIQAIMSQENTKWMSVQERTSKSQGTTGVG